MAKKAKKKTSKRAKTVIEEVLKEAEKESFMSWFASKMCAKLLKPHQQEELKAFFRDMKLDPNQEEKGKYDKAFDKF